LTEKLTEINTIKVAKVAKITKIDDKRETKQEEVDEEKVLKLLKNLFCPGVINIIFDYYSSLSTFDVCQDDLEEYLTRGKIKVKSWDLEDGRSSEETEMKFEMFIKDQKIKFLFPAILNPKIVVDHRNKLIQLKLFNHPLKVEILSPELSITLLNKNINFLRNNLRFSYPPDSLPSFSNDNYYTGAPDYEMSTIYINLLDYTRHVDSDLLDKISNGNDQYYQSGQDSRDQKEYEKKY
jgi:hypothetical protein